ncbi:MAG: PilZ domain-containing protein [Smithellaceae bacterium]
MSEESSKPLGITTPLSSSLPLPWTFQNERLLEQEDQRKKIPLNKLINKLNYLNFTGGTVSVLFALKPSGNHILMTALPRPCMSETITCTLKPPHEVDALLYEPDYLMIDDGLATILAPVHLISRQGDDIDLALSAEASVIIKRQTRRYPCRNITCEIRQDQIVMDGRMVEFSPTGMSVILSPSLPPAPWDENKPVRLDLFDQDTKLFTGLCRCIRNGTDMPDGRTVFAPLDDQSPLYIKRDFRNPRQHTTPSFTIKFRHPFSLRIVERDIVDISTSGFSIQEHPEQQTLMPGLMIPDVCILYAGVAEMQCSAQVVYRRQDDQAPHVQYGLAINDMAIDAFTRLNHLVGAHLDTGANVSTTVDMDALWEFFFETDFIYGEKYEHLYPYRDSFKDMYRKLYQNHPDIARHFIYQKNGKIYGHIAMVHAYTPTWIIHHFSALPLESKIPGLLILRQIAHYLNGFYRLRSRTMQYVMTYYRPDNKVVSRIFGGFAGYLNNPKGSSLDLFAYLYFNKGTSSAHLPAEWSLRQSMADDFHILNTFYENRAGGLLLDALHLDASIKDLKENFGSSGLKRNCQTMCLRHQEKPVAFFVVNESDFGLNLSDLLNGITAIIVDEDALPWPVLESVVEILSSFYMEDKVPLLVYPDTYPAGQNRNITKKYQLWILKTDPHAEEYLEYIGSKFRIKYRQDK